MLFSVRGVLLLLFCLLFAHDVIGIKPRAVHIQRLDLFFSNTRGAYHRIKKKLILIIWLGYNSIGMESR